MAQSPTSERASKPLAHALDATLAMLMDERITQMRGLFEEIDERFAEHQRLIEDQQNEIDGLKRQLGLKFQSVEEKLDGSLKKNAREERARWKDDGYEDTRRDQNAHTRRDQYAHDDEDRPLTAKDQRKMQEQMRRDMDQSRELTLHDVEARVEALEDRVDDLDQTVEELDKALEEDQDMRTGEIDKINEVLNQIEKVQVSRDLQMEARRRAYMESQVRKVVFRMGMRALSRSFSTWQALWRHNRRLRFLLFKSLGHWRRCRLASAFGPWARLHHVRTVQKQSHEIARLDDSANVLEDKVQEIGTRVHDPQTYQSMPIPDTHMEEIERILDDRNNEMMKQMEEDTDELRKIANEAASMAKDGHVRIDNEIITWLEAQRQHSIESSLRKVLLRKLLNELSRAFKAWVQFRRLVKRKRYLMLKASYNLRNRLAAKAYRAWMTFMRIQDRDKRQAELKQLSENILQQVEEGRIEPGLTEEQLTELQSIIQDVVDKSQDATEAQIAEQAEIIQLIGNNLGYKDEDLIPSTGENGEDGEDGGYGETAGLLGELQKRVRDLEAPPDKPPEIDANTLAQQRRAYIESQIRIKLYRIKMVMYATMFSRWKEEYLLQKKRMEVVLKALSFWRRGANMQFFTLWKRYTAKAQTKKALELARDLEIRMQELMESKVESVTIDVKERFNDVEEHMNELSKLQEKHKLLQLQLTRHTEEVQTSSQEKRKMNIERVLQKVLAKIMHRMMTRAFSGWYANVANKIRVSNLKTKVLWRMEILHAARAFSPWLVAARQKIADVRADEFQKLEDMTAALAGKIGAQDDMIEQIHEENEDARTEALHRPKSEFFHDDDEEDSSTPASTSTGAAGGPANVNTQSWHQDIQEQVDKLKDQDSTAAALRTEISERLEHLEVTLREDFQHVEVRCDMLGRQLAQARGQSWKDMPRPREQPLPSKEFRGSHSTQANTADVEHLFEERFASLKKELDTMRESLQGADDNSLQEERVHAKQDMEKIAGILENVQNLKAEMEALSRRQEDADKEIKDVHTDLAGKQSEIRAARTSLDEMRVLGGNNVEKTAELKGALDAAQAQSQSIHKSLSDLGDRVMQVERWDSEIKRVDQVSQKVEVVSDRIGQVYADVSTLKATIDVADMKLQLTETNKSVQAAVSALPQIFELKSDLDTLKRVHDTTRQDMIQINQIASRMAPSDTVKDVKNDVDRVRDSVHSLTTGLTKVFELKSEVDAIGKLMQASEREGLPRVIADVQMLKDARIGNEKKIDSLTQDAHKAKVKVTSLESRMIDTQEQLNEHLTTITGKLSRFATPGMPQHLASAALVGTESKPDEFSKVSRRITELKIEREHLQRGDRDKDSSHEAASRVRDINAELARLQGDLEALFKEEVPRHAGASSSGSVGRPRTVAPSSTAHREQAWRRAQRTGSTGRSS